MKTKNLSYVSAAAMLVLLGSAGADAGDRIVPIKATASSPGNLRPETCSRPTYPKQDLEQKHGGTVTLRFLLGADGAVKRSVVHTSSGHASLDEAARLAIVKCRFNPPMVDGKPVEGWTAVQYVWEPLAEK
jgi:TonB family protein